MNPTPTPGRIVLFKSKDQTQIGIHSTADEVPAIVTRVWSDTTVNLTVFRDADSPVTVSSVSMADDFETSGQHCAWRWMPYQKAVAAGQIAATLHAEPAATPPA